MLVERTKKLLLKEYLRLLEARLVEDAQLDSLSPGLGQLLGAQARTVVLMLEIKEDQERRKQEHVQRYAQELKRTFPIKSRVSDWLNECVEAETVIKIFVFFLVI